jgi:hypothetical protein
MLSTSRRRFAWKMSSTRGAILHRISSEVDRASASLNKFVIFAALGVPEIWRVFKKEVRFYVLSGDSYAEASTSRAFSFLDSAVLTKFIALGLEEGGRKAARGFRTWVSKNRTAD